jgi:hypothetical protein
VLIEELIGGGRLKDKMGRMDRKNVIYAEVGI